MNHPSPEPQQHPLSHDTLVTMLGDISDAKAAAIIATGASLNDLEQAIAWAGQENDVMGRERHPLSGVVAEVYEIMTADEEYGDERNEHT
jgi:hypothetical protein